MNNDCYVSRFTTFVLSDIVTVAMAFPAYIGLLNVSGLITSMTSLRESGRSKEWMGRKWKERWVERGGWGGGERERESVCESVGVREGGEDEREFPSYYRAAISIFTLSSPYRLMQCSMKR
jgi:hypothetical protein